MKIGIVGAGHVGSAMHEIFLDAHVYDPNKKMGSKDEINKCDIAFVCVPTPSLPDGRCDTSIVEEVIAWLTVPVIVLRSTVYIGFTDEMKGKYNKRIIFQPEYYGETTAHPFADLHYRPWLSFGGAMEDVQIAIQAYQQVYNSSVEIHVADACTTELAKYMENAFLAMKVTFVNEFYDIARAMNLSYDMVREIWLADPRMGRSHTFVYQDNRGYGGSCLPKDVASIICQAEDFGADVSLMKAMVEKNTLLRAITTSRK